MYSCMQKSDHSANLHILLIFVLLENCTQLLQQTKRKRLSAIVNAVILNLINLKVEIHKIVVVACAKVWIQFQCQVLINSLVNYYLIRNHWAGQKWSLGITVRGLY